MKTIIKLVLSATVVAMCCAGVYLLQQVTPQSSFTHRIEPVNNQVAFYKTPELPVYKNQDYARSSQSRQSTMFSLPTTPMSSQSEKPATNVVSGHSYTDMYNSNQTVVSSISARRTASPEAGVGVASQIFIAYGSKGGSTNNSYNSLGMSDNRLVDGKGASIGMLGTGDGYIPPDGNFEDLVSLPVGNGVWVLLILAVGYVAMRMRKHDNAEMQMM